MLEEDREELKKTIAETIQEARPALEKSIYDRLTRYMIQNMGRKSIDSE